MVERGTVTVVVATHNRCERLRSCLIALLDLPEQPEVIVVDNASTDNTATMVRLRFPAVQLIRLKADAGVLARNVGTQRAGTAAVAFADEDSGWAPGSLDRANQLILRHPRLAVVAGRTRIGPDAGDHHTDELAAELSLSTQDDLPAPPVPPFRARSAVLRRDALLGVGGFPRAALHAADELRLARKLVRAGWDLTYCTDVIAWCDGVPVDTGPLETGIVAAASQ
jgi:GT2 family glycosyltransferase